MTTKFPISPTANLPLLVLALIGSREFNRRNLDMAIAEVIATWDLSPGQSAGLHAHFKWVAE